MGAQQTMSCYVTSNYQCYIVLFCVHTKKGAERAGIGVEKLTGNKNDPKKKGIVNNIQH